MAEVASPAPALAARPSSSSIAATSRPLPLVDYQKLNGDVGSLGRAARSCALLSLASLSKAVPQAIATQFVNVVKREIAPMLLRLLAEQESDSVAAAAAAGPSQGLALPGPDGASTARSAAGRGAENESIPRAFGRDRASGSASGHNRELEPLSLRLARTYSGQSGTGATLAGAAGYHAYGHAYGESSRHSASTAMALAGLGSLSGGPGAGWRNALFSSWQGLNRAPG